MFTSLPVPTWLGILNITPDSFSDGGHHQTAASAVERARILVAGGATILDVGGVSTRPGSKDVSAGEEWNRVADILTALRVALPGALLSLDTSSPTVLARAADLGLVDIANDVWSGRKIEGGQTTFDVCAANRIPLIVMHMRGEPGTMQEDPRYVDCVTEVASFLQERARAAFQAGVPEVAIDPGIGFGKRLEHNLALLSQQGMAALVSLGYPVLVGLSRKRFLAELEAAKATPDKALFENASALDAVSKEWELRCIAAGAHLVRSHRAPAEKEFVVTEQNPAFTRTR